MSGATTAMWVGAGIAAAGAAASIYGAEKQADAQRDATRQAERQAQQTAERSRQEQRRQNAQQADVSGILQQNAQAASGGGSTLLTGASGVQNSQLNLGQGSMLG